MPLVSVVIPTLNEELHLPKLLTCLKVQSCPDFEVLVCDAGSHDSTQELCRSEGIRLLPGGTPAVARNRGARTASAPFILFLDADVTFGANFIERAVAEAQRNRWDGVSFQFSFDAESFSLRMVSLLANAYFRRTTASGFPHGLGGAFLVRRTAHQDIGGFDEQLTVAEDQDYACRLSRGHRYAFVNEPGVRISARRFQRLGILSQSVVWVRIESHRITHGEITDDRFRYFEKGRF